MQASCVVVALRVVSVAAAAVLLAFGSPLLSPPTLRATAPVPALGVAPPAPLAPPLGFPVVHGGADVARLPPPASDTVFVLVSDARYWHKLVESLETLHRGGMLFPVTSSRFSLRAF